MQARVEGSTLWEGCALEMRDRSVSEVDEHAALAARSRAADEAEAERLKARFNLQQCLINCKEEVGAHFLAFVL